MREPVDFYNDNDQSACEWMRELIKADLIPPGTVNGQSIQDLQPQDVQGFRRVHLFAGIGGWVYALELAGWPADRPVWTGSCPCQPFSCAGRRQGEMDERHLWPEFYRLIAECRPATIFGEQVASNDGLEWLDGVLLDLEELGYAVAAADLPAACVKAPHGRQRLWWVASDTDGHECDGRNSPVQVRRGIGAGAMARTVLTQDVEWPAESKPLALAYGVSNRLGRVRGFGNAIVPQVAAKFIRAYLG